MDITHFNMESRSRRTWINRETSLADADVVRNEQTDGIELEHHEEWDHLVGTRFHADPGKSAERAGARAEAEAYGIAKEFARAVVAWN